MIRKMIATILTLVLIVFLTELGMPCQVKAASKMWFVDDDGPGDFHTIQEAINAANDIDTIKILEGTYGENVVVNKSISLVGEDLSSIIDGGDRRDVITIVADYVTIVNLTIRDSGEYYGGIFVDDCENVEIANSVIKDNDNGIIVSQSYEVTISHNIIDSSGWDGITIRQSSVCLVRGNTISSNRNSGLTILESNEITVQGNTISDNYYGMYLYSSSSVVVFDNGMINNSQQVSSNPSLFNTWNQSYPKGGNYWSDYTGPDSDNDGIGDVSYVIDESNADHLPLMGAFYSFSTAKMQVVEIISNSTILDFRYFESNDTIRMHVTNATPMQTYGFCRIVVPHEIINGTYVITIDGAESYTLNGSEYDDGISSWFHFTYRHSPLSAREITIVPELSNLQAIIMLTTLALLVVMFRKILFVGAAEPCSQARKNSRQMNLTRLLVED